MVTQVVDTRGLSCPAPVLLVKEAVERMGAFEITVLVDNEPSRENVNRFLQSRKYIVTETQEDLIYRLQARCKEDALSAVAEPGKKSREEAAPKKILVLVAADQFGAGDGLLGKKLMISYLKTLREMGSELWRLIFLNGGVRLTTSTSPVLSELQEYERSGVTVLSCGTCLEHFDLTAEKAVGATTNMLDIVTATQLADKVITIC